MSVSFPERRQRKPPNLPATSIAYCSCPLCVPSVVCVVCILLCSFVLPATRSYMSTRLRSMTTWSITSFLYSTFVSVEHSWTHTSLEDVAICDLRLRSAFSASRSCCVVSAILYRNLIFNCVLVYATLFTWKPRRQRQKVLAMLLRCALWQRDSRIDVNCRWDKSRHGSIRSHVFIPRSSPCLRLSASRWIGALCSCRWWRTTAGTYPETQILHSWTLRLMQGISEHFWQQLSPISSGKSCNKQLVYNDAFNTEQEHNTNTFGCQDAGISYGYLQLKVDVVAQILYAFTCVVNSSFLVGGEISYRSIGKSIKFCVHQYLVAYSLIGKLLFFLEVHIFGYWLGNNYIPKLAEQY